MKRLPRLLILVLPLCLCAGRMVSAADPRIAYAPDVVGVDRMFLVALKVPKDAPDIGVKAPDCVKLFDRTRLPAKADVRKFYFRAVAPAPRAEIRFDLPGGELVVPIEIWSFEDLRKFRTLKGVQLPRRWPLGERLPELKQRQTYTTGAEAKKPVRPSSGGWLDYSDDDIWAMQPDSTIPRWHWTNIQHGCPVHGREIYGKRAYYPWIMDDKSPWRWKIRCPIGGEEYPSNNFARGDMTSGEFADDGIGGGCEHEGRKYAFVAELCQFYCRQMMSVAPGCGGGYASTGDRQFAHKALVALSRLAVEYAYLATMTQHRHRNVLSQTERLGQGRFDEGPCLVASAFTTYGVEQPGQLWANAQAYDRIFPVIDQDREIIPFLRRKGFDVKTHEDVRRFIEENLFAVWMQGIMDRACNSNEPEEQQALARTATVLNYARGADFMDWLYDGHGKMRVFITNGFFRDGAPYESTGGYNRMHVSALGPIVEAIERLRALRPEVYPEARYPSLVKNRRYRGIFDFCMDTVTIDRAFPQVGDTGEWPRHEKLDKITWHSALPEAMEHAWRLFRDPKFAWALARSREWKPGEEMAAQRAAIERQAAHWPETWNERSSLHDGYGLAVLRGGQGDQKRALWMMYGRLRGHGQDEIMNIGLQGHQGTLLSHMGYPRNWGYWEPAWSSHHLARQFPIQDMTAQMHLFSEASPVRIAEARAQAFVDRVDEGKGYELPPDHWQRRLIALVDITPEKFYCLDFYRVSGGKEHWRSFFCQEGEFTTSGLELPQPAPGTLAGPEVAYGDAEWLKSHCGVTQYGPHGPMFPFAHFYNVQTCRPSGPWWADWKLKTAGGLRLRLSVPSTDGMDVNVCDGRAPSGGSPYEMKWILTRAKAEPPATSQMISVIEPYMEHPVVRAVQPLEVSGMDEHGFAPQGCEVQLAGGTDYVLWSADASVSRNAGPLKFAGRFGFYRQRKGVPLAMSLVGGTRLSNGRYGIVLDAPEYRGKIVQVDRQSETITVKPPPPSAESVLGAEVFIGNSRRRIAYRVVGAKLTADEAQLRLASDSQIGTGRASGVAKDRVTTATPFPLHRYRYYHGARLVNAQRTAEYSILDARDQRAVFIDPAVHPLVSEAKLAREFLKDSWFDIYDYGVGDEVVRPYAASVTQTAPGQYLLISPVPARVGLPEGARLVTRATAP